MTLLPNEQVVVTSNGNKVILTTHRIQLTDKGWGGYYRIVFFLEHISSIEIRLISNVIFLVLAGLAVVFGVYLYGNQDNPFNVGAIAAIIFLMAWWFTRKRVVSISSYDGSRMNIEVNEMSQEDIESFIEDVQLAQLSVLKV
jgi:hypothetical protein